MSSKSWTAIDLDQLLVIADERGCACNQIFDGPCLVHYAQDKLDNRAEKASAHSVRSTTPVTRVGASPERTDRPDTDFRGAGRGTGGGRKERPAKPARKR